MRENKFAGLFDFVLSTLTKRRFCVKKLSIRYISSSIRRQRQLFFLIIALEQHLERILLIQIQYEEDSLFQHDKFGNLLPKFKEI